MQIVGFSTHRALKKSFVNYTISFLLNIFCFQSLNPTTKLISTQEKFDHSWQKREREKKRLAPC